jgi:imidazoleglycerol-phosphate dehydratase
MRNGTIHRVTGETDVRVRFNLDGTGRCQASTGVLFLNHMLHQISSHSLLDLEISAMGDTHIDDHHPHKDVGIAIGDCVGPLDEGKRRSPLRPAG